MPEVRIEMATTTELEDLERPSKAVSTRVRYGILAIITIATAINYMDRANLSIVAPDVKADLHISEAELGLIFSAFSWTYAVLQIPGGWVLDRVGPRITFGVALIFWSIVTGSISLAKGFGSLLGLRLALGVAETPAFPANNALVSRWFPTKERGLATGAYTAGEYVGLAIAAPLLAWMAVTYGWHSVFYLTGGLGLVFAFVWLIFIRNSPQSDKRVSRSEIDLIEKGGGAVKTAHSAEGGQHAKFSDIPKLLRHKRMVGALIGQFANTSTLFFFLTWFPTYLVEQKHFTLLKAGIMVTIPYLVALLGTLAAGSWSDWMLRRGVATTIARKTPIISGLILSMIVIFDNFVNNPALVITFFSIAFFAQGMASATAWALLSDIAPAKQLGLTGGLFNFFANAGGALSPLVIGLIVGATGSFAYGLVYIAVIAGIGALSYIFLVDRVERIEL
jgi:ACS family D-galactonate transporter-like MFS transporter